VNGFPQLTRQDAINPKQKAVTDYKEQADKHPPPTPSTGKLKSRRTNTTTTDITTRNPVNNGPRKQHANTHHILDPNISTIV